MTEADWHAARGLAMLLGHAGDRVLLAVQGEARIAGLVLPGPRPGHVWRLLADSADPQRQGPAAGDLLLAPRSVVLLAEEAVPDSAQG
jgi:glycogen operon protein